MKKFLLFAALLVSAIAANAYTYNVSLADAHWDFEDAVNVRPTASSAAFYVPNTWKTGTSIAAYMPYVYPNGNQSTDPDRGYNSRHCLYLQNPNSASRVPVYAMMPKVNETNYADLKLEFMARTFNSTMDTQTSNTVYGDWKLGYLTSLDDTLKANFSANVHFATDINLTANWTKYSFDLDTIPNGAYMVLYVTDATHIRYMYVDDVAFVLKSGSPEPQPTPEITISYHLTGCVGDAENPTEWDNDEGQAEMVFVLEDGYEWGSVTVTIDGTAVSDMMTDFDADPAYYLNISGDSATLYLYYMEGDVEDSVVVTMTAVVPAAPAVTPVPGAATFEEYTAVLPASGDKYCPWENDGTHYWQSGDYTFSCTRSWSGMMNDGFYPANYSDTTYNSYADDYKALPCSGAEGSDAYASMYYGGSWGGPCTVTFSERTLTGTYITLALNPYLCINGRSWCAAFANGDYLYLHLMGKKNGVYTNTSVDFYLADYRNGKTDVITSWEWLDLSSLGSVDEVECVIYDSQNGAGVGLYCCFDNFGGVAPAPTPTAVINNTAATRGQKVFVNGQLYIRQGNTFYTTEGQKVR